MMDLGSHRLRQSWKIGHFKYSKFGDFRKKKFDGIKNANWNFEEISFFWCFPRNFQNKHCEILIILRKFIFQVGYVMAFSTWVCFSAPRTTAIPIANSKNLCKNLAKTLFFYGALAKKNTFFYIFFLISKHFSRFSNSNLGQDHRPYANVRDIWPALVARVFQTRHGKYEHFEIRP